MPHTCETRRAGGATGLGNAVCLAANSPENSPTERPPQPQNGLRLQFLVARLRALVEEAIERHLPPHEYLLLMAAEESERQAINALVFGGGDDRF
jgi:hypothetical protein